MDHTLNNATPRQFRLNECFLLVLFVLLLIYQSVGIFPIAPIEGDGTGIANGAKQIALSGIMGSNPLGYRYGVQSGTYALIVLAHKLTGSSTLVCFSLLSAFSSVMFIMISAAFLKRITSYSYATCGIVILLFQEAFTGGYYANSTVIAAAFSILALYVMTLSNRFYILLLAAILLGLGVWMRFDVLFIAPSIVLLLYRGHWKQTLYQTSIVALITAAISLSAIYLSGTGIEAIFTSANTHLTASASYTPNLGIPFLGSADVKSFIAFFSIALLLSVAIGTFYLIRTKNWRLLSVFLIGIVPFYVVYLGKMTTPKYMYYLVPFFSIPVLFAFSEIRQTSTKRRRMLLASVVTLFLTQYIIGLQASFVTKPYIEKSHPTFLTLFTTDIPTEAIDNISIVVGSGSQINTADGDRLSSGILFAPISWYQTKTEINADLKKIYRFIADSGNQQLSFLATQYGSRQLALFILLDNGYRCEKRSNLPEQFVCTKDDAVATLLHQPYAGRDYSSIESALSLVNTSDVIFLPGASWEKDLFLRNAKNWKEISRLSYEIEK